MFDTGLHSALQHDKIMMSSNPDFVLVESEAENVARQASLALKRSRRRINAQPGVPTWTGQHGMAGAPRVTYVSTHTSTTLSSADAKY